MFQKLTAVLAALAFALTTFAPVAAEARDRRDGYYDRHYDGYYDRRHRRHRDHDDDAAVAGVVGLVLGVALGAALSEPRQAPMPRAQCYDNYQRCGGPPPGYYDQDYYDDGYGLEGGYDPRYDDRRQQTCQLRRWDDYARRYIIEDVPC